MLRFKETFRIVLPFFLVCDMVHSCYYVSKLYKRRLQVMRVALYMLQSGMLASAMQEMKAPKVWSAHDATGMARRGRGWASGRLISSLTPDCSWMCSEGHDCLATVSISSPVCVHAYSPINIPNSSSWWRRYCWGNRWWCKPCACWRPAGWAWPLMLVCHWPICISSYKDCHGRLDGFWKRSLASGSSWQYFGVRIRHPETHLHLCSNIVRLTASSNAEDKEPIPRDAKIVTWWTDEWNNCCWWQLHRIWTWSLTRQMVTYAHRSIVDWSRSLEGISQTQAQLPCLMVYRALKRRATYAQALLLSSLICSCLLNQPPAASQAWREQYVPTWPAAYQACSAHECHFQQSSAHCCSIGSSALQQSGSAGRHHAGEDHRCCWGSWAAAT